MNQIKEQVAADLEEIQTLIRNQLDDHIAQLERRFKESSSFLEFELQIKKFTNDYGRILLEQMIPKIFGSGYYGPKVEEVDEETGAVKVKARENVRFLGFIKGKATKRFNINAEGKIEEKAPWYRFLYAEDNSE